MVGKEIKRLSRRELVDIIYQLKKNEQENREKIEALEEELQDKRIRVSVAGSIAEAATDITHIFATAQRTADLYLHEIAAMKEETEKECAKVLDDAKRQAEKILMEARDKRG
jgi:cell division septum initiation protein DivIVA